MLIDFSKKILKHIDVLFIFGYALLLLADILYKNPFIGANNDYIVLASYCVMALYIFAQFILNKLYKPSLIFKDKKNIFYIIASLFIMYSYLVTKDATFIRILLIATCLVFMNFKKFIKIDIIIKVILISITISLALNNIIPNQIFYRESGFARQALGFKNPNQLSLYLMVMLFEVMYLKNTKKSFLFILLAIITIIFEYFVINTQTVMALIPVMVVFYLMYIWGYKFIGKIFENKVIKILIYSFPVILTALIFIAINMYDSNPESMKLANKLFSGRVQFCSIFFKEYNISLFGNNIPDCIHDYIVLDNMYLKLLLKFGIVQYFIYVAILFANVKKAYKLKEYNVIFIILLLELYGLMETITIIPTYSIFILYMIPNLLKKDNFEHLNVNQKEHKNSKYYVCEGKAVGDYNASTKARKDIENILDECGYEKLFIPTKFGVKKNKILKFMQIYYYIKNKNIWYKSLEKLEKGDEILIQYPLINTCVGLEKVLEKYNKYGIKIIALVHDLDSLRYKPNVQGKMLYKRVCKEDKKILNSCSYIVAHNNKMKEYLISLKNDESKIIVLELFDYLIDTKLKEFDRKKNEPIIIAGNLSREKAEYLKYLPEIKNVKFNLYGRGYEPGENEENVEYKGAFLPEELLNNLEGAFGLVWDGISKETCEGGFGEYLKYNNPHKVSMYLAAGIPVIIWKNAALAEFIEKNDLGYAIESLDDLSKIEKNITDEEYNNKIQNAKNISQKIVSGYFTKNAINKI